MLFEFGRVVPVSLQLVALRSAERFDVALSELILYLILEQSCGLQVGRVALRYSEI